MRILDDLKIKIGEDLIPIINKIRQNKDLVDQAASLYQKTMDEFCAQYKGKALENVKLFKEVETTQIQKLSQMYERVATLMEYSLRQTQYVDDSIGKQIHTQLQPGEVKSND